jgi:hypothetical protein
MVFVGRFSNLTFSVAPGTAGAPQVNGADGTANSAFAPVHQQHLGLWFTSPEGAVAPAAGAGRRRSTRPTTPGSTS